MQPSKARANLRLFRIKNVEDLDKAEEKIRMADDSTEYVPWADGTEYKEIAQQIIRDRDGDFVNPLILISSLHKSTHGIRNLCQKAEDYLRDTYKRNIDILSIGACMEGSKISLKILVRAYTGKCDFAPFFRKIGDNLFEEEVDNTPSTGRLVVPEEIKNFEYTKEQITEHTKQFNKQHKVLERSDYDKPFLNSIEHYYPHVLPKPEDHLDLIYDLKTADQKIDTVMPYEDFYSVFCEIMTYVNGTEYYSYVNVMKGDKPEEEFLSFLREYIISNYVRTKRLELEDLEMMMKKLYRSLFQLYIVQDLIDDPQVTDIKITAPDSIRARIKGKAYITNINFIDANDYKRFVNGIAIRNRISLNVPEQTFTDSSDDNYVMRFSITAEYVNSVPWPYVHIRKISRKKMMAPELIKAGMFDEKIRDYLLDCGKTSRGVVFAGPPGSGKTVALNWFLEEAYEQSAEILVIQENDELFCNRKGVMFQHVVNYSKGSEQTVNLEQLGQLALVAGANVFIIGEAKGAEICSAITLSNSGCRTAITIHSPSSTETIDKMADLAMRGYAQDLTQAKRMLRSFQTIVYLESFSVREISEITGYNEHTGEMEYRYIYRKDAD